MTRLTWILVAAVVLAALVAAMRCSTGLRADPPVRTID
jgi:hypothetical protein